MILDGFRVCHEKKWRGTDRLEVLVYNNSRRFYAVAQVKSLILKVNLAKTSRIVGIGSSSVFRYATPFFKFNLQSRGKNFTYVGMSISKYPRIKLEWIDILGDTAWADNDEFNDMQCSTCVSEGFLFYKDDKVIMTFASYEIENDEIISFGDRNIYPIGCVKNITYV